MLWWSSGAKAGLRIPARYYLCLGDILGVEAIAEEASIDAPKKTTTRPFQASAARG
jgi:hypothetical protein